LTLAAELAKAEKRLVWILELELGHRIEGDTWTLSGSGVYWMNHAAEGEPNRVRVIRSSTHALSTYAKKASLAECEAAAESWYYDGSNGRLYVHTTDGGTPASGYLVCSHFWRRYTSSQTSAAVLDAGGAWLEPRLAADSIPDVGLEISDFASGGVKESWGEIRLLNPDGALDADLGAYVWHMAVFYLKVGAAGDAYGDFKTVCRGRTGSVTWTEAEITLGVEDQLRAED
jgi:hypothetical protein